MVVPEVRKAVPLPDDVTASIAEDGKVTVQGPNGTLERTFRHPRITLKMEDNEVVVHTAFPRKKTRALTGTWAAHIRNMAKGAKDGFEYQMKVVYSHFPIKSKVVGKELVIENFLGEKTPRKAPILPDVEVKVAGDDITVTGANKETVSQTAANIEQACIVRGYDIRVFQDGIYVTSKGE